MRCDTDLDQADYDKRTVGHLAAAEGHIEMLEYLAKHSKFNFDLKDRWDNPVLGELADLEAKARIEALFAERSALAKKKLPSLQAQGP